MKSDNQNKISARNTSAFARIEKLHPVKMLLYLSLLGVGMVFLVMVIGFIRSEASIFRQQQIPFPKFFSISTLLLLFSSYTLRKVPRLYRRDNLLKMARYLSFTLLLGFAFLLSQLAGWYELVSNNVFIKGRAFGSYLYLIPALHMLHLLAGILFLTYFFIKTRIAASDAVRTLVFIRDPYRKLQISLLSTYWHFMDGMWAALFLVFLFCF
jgi:cytochrome c oxidase subunit 3